MTSLPESFNFGDTSDMSIEDLVFKLQTVYTTLARAINQKPNLYSREQNGQTNDTDLADGTINLNTATNKVEMLTNHVSPILVQWTTLS